MKTKLYAWLPALIICITAATLLTGAVAFIYLKDIMMDDAADGLAMVAVDIADKLDRTIAERHGDIQMLARAFPPIVRDRARLTESLNWMKSAYPVYQWLGVVDARGRIVAATNPASVGQDRHGREWFQAARDRGGVHIRDVRVSEDSNGIPAVAFTAPITGPRGEFLGAVTTRVALPVLEEIFAESTQHLAQEVGKEQGRSTRIEYQFLDRAGNLIIDSPLRGDNRVNLKRLAVPSALLLESAGPGHIEEMHERRRVPVVTGYAKTGGYRGMPGLRWGVLVRMDRSDIETPYMTVLHKLSAAGIIVVAPMLGLLIWATVRLRKEWSVAQKETARAKAAESVLLMKNTELSKALQEVKVLRGLIPICMSCKKIQTDGGYWQQIEGYIQEHSDAQFSHGICQHCMKKLYPEFSEEEE